jgi:high affinity Mn2+ porin
MEPLHPAMTTHARSNRKITSSAVAIMSALLWGSALPLARAASPAPTPESGQQSPAPQPDISTASTSPDAPPTVENWAIHGQSTFTGIYQPAFTSPYRGPQSLDPGSRARETWDVTLYGGVRPWRGAEIWVNPEVDQGFGPSNTFGLGGYVSAEAYKLGSADPYVRVPRLFFRQTLDLGGDVQSVAPDLNQLGGTQTANRVVLTIGKFSSFDVFDTNKYAHDPRNDFLNWSLIDAGSFDQAGDAWGFSYGAAAEWYQDWWTIRGGIFDMPTVPAYKYLDPHLFHQLQYVAEVEERHTLFGQDGKVKLSGFYSRGLFGSYAQATALGLATGTTPDIQAVLRFRGKGGGSVNVEQGITDDLGFFFRAGLQDGSSSVTSYTDIDNTVSFGLSLAGKRWNRPDDTVGIGFARNDISRHLKNYLNAGGLGILIGDGKLPNSGPESVIEAFYSLAAYKGVNITADYQFINNPAYNRDRGPVNFLGTRLHVQF